MDPVQDYASIMNGDAPPPPPAAASPFLGITQPQPDISQIQKPAATPEELQQRQSGWQQLLNNPNFMRAVGVMGAHLAQPRPAGQTRMGQLGTGFAAGQTAMQMGEYAQYQQDMQQKEEARKQAESTANVANTQSGTALNVAKAPGAAADSKVAVETADARIASANLTKDLAKFNFDKAKSVEEVDRMKLELAKRAARIEGEIPDEALRKAASAEVAAAALKADEARARIGASQAAAGASAAAAKASGVKTAADQITIDVLKGMETSERKEFLTKTGRYSTHVNSATVARDMYGSIYDGLQKSSPSDPRIKGKSREQFVLDGITSQKSLDATTSLKNYMTAISTANLDPDPEIVQALSDQIKTGAKARAGNASPAAGAGSPEVWVRDKNGKLVRQSVQNPGPAK